MSPLINPDRRDFVILSVSLGLCALASPYALAENLKKLGLNSDEYHGQLISKLDTLFGRLDRREITAEGFVTELDKRFDEIDLEAEFNTWIQESHKDNEMKKIFRRKMNKHSPEIQLFFIAPGSAHPPHAHHDLMSIQRVLRGKVNVRQFDRIARLDDKHLTLKPTNDSVLGPGGKIIMTELKNNVHWFGAVDQPALILDANFSGTLDKTFDLPGSRKNGRYYVDPTKGRAGALIVAQEISIGRCVWPLFPQDDFRFSRLNTISERVPLRISGRAPELCFSRTPTKRMKRRLRRSR
jgi:hypothetical protein